MTQFDLPQLAVPQLSLQRYVDLLRRRRWQVIPVSLFGLLVGGLVAVFIPRYYVADVLIEHQQAPVSGEPAATGKDPILAIVDTARMTLPLAVGETMKDLRWPEALVANEYERTQNERDVRSRLVITDLNQVPQRSYAQLRVAFRDLDGKRAASFLNTLVPKWKQKRLDEQRRMYELLQQQAKLEDSLADRAYDAALSERRETELKYGIDPQLTIEMHQQQVKDDRFMVQRVRDAVAENERKHLALTSLLRADQDKLAGTAARAPMTLDRLVAALSKYPIGPSLYAKIAYCRGQVEIYRETTPEHVRYSRELERAEKQLLELLGPDVLDAAGTMPNPEYEALAAKIRGQEEELDRLALAIEQGHKFIADDGERLRVIVGVFSRYEKLLQDQREAEQNRDLARRQVKEADNLIAKLTNQQLIKIVEPAQEPPRPTEPNILVVALIGCVLGLALAVALILLLDVVQGSFKTIEDVESGLPVPVLGGMSHLETDAERERAIRVRRRTTVAAAAFVGLCVALVLLFYADPTRLPPLVRDLLALLLGA